MTDRRVRKSRQGWQKPTSREFLHVSQAKVRAVLVKHHTEFTTLGSSKQVDTGFATAGDAPAAGRLQNGDTPCSELLMQRLKRQVGPATIAA
ncbi:hypothetical protein GCM10022255_069090 [Dactylosporangium darangshiense]|uniref:Uncharacterized protein n=1 Tax=Dactylosporangium darangshiense TaxID=579108 RepID=A0ABP8DI71_9ACTN